MVSSEITIYTDGACSGNPGSGGYGAVLLWCGQEKHLSGFAFETTNNRMELMGAIVALEELKRSMEIILVTDSKYVKDGVERWLANWKRNGWRTSSKAPVKNRDLWERLDLALSRHRVSWRWIKGHSGDKYNDLADELARQAIASHRS